MAAREKRSKRRSDTKLLLQKRLDSYTFFVDRSLGKNIVPQAPIEAGIHVKLHADHFPDNAPDVFWLLKCGKENWVVLAKDRAIQKNEIERQALFNAGLAVFLLTSANTTGEENAKSILKGSSKIADLLEHHLVRLSPESPKRVKLVYGSILRERIDYTGNKDMYNPLILDYLENPRNVGEMTDAAARGEATNPVCGDLLQLYLKVEEGKITAASFLVEGCPPSIAAGSVMTEMVRGLTIEEARRMRPKDVTQALGGLPRNKEHCSILAIDALRAALAELPPAVV